MAQKVEIRFVDDIDGSEAEGTVRFGLDGREFEIDLSAANRAKLAKAVSPFVEKARKMPSGRRGTSPPPKHDQLAVREWARSQGMKVSSRGRIPVSVIQAYEAAH